jgi:CBS domain-containing protein
MEVGEICSRVVVFIGRNESVADAARLMRKHHIGSLVVADKRNGRLVPAGMITDRDVAVGVVALGLARVREDEDVARALELMRAHAVRRLPVVDASGAPVGLLAADDLLQLLGEQIATLANVVERGLRREGAERRAPAKQML